MDFPNGEAIADPAKFRRRILIGPDGNEAGLRIEAVGNKSGVLRFDASIPALYVIGVETQPRLISLTAEEFNGYLLSEGLPHCPPRLAAPARGDCPDFSPAED